MYELKKMEKYLRVNLLGPGPRLMKNEFTGTRSHKGWETLFYDNVTNKNDFTALHKHKVYTLVNGRVWGKLGRDYLARPWRSCVDNIKIQLQEMGWGRAW